MRWLKVRHMMTGKALVQAMEQRHILPAAIREAFLAIDRGVFVPSYYQHQGTQWILQSAKTVVYENRPLVIQVAHGLPSSSSSLPSLMATMLEALDLKAGLRVLEIGTGTGYNAALMAHLVGEHGAVISVDIDEELVQAAQDHLKAAGIGQIRALVANGLQGYAPEAPYDRIIVTGGFRHLAPAWQEQLALSGLLVGNLLGNIASVVLRLVKEERGVLVGTLLAEEAMFIELHEGVLPAINPFDWRPFDALAQETHTLPSDLSQLIHDPGFLLLLEMTMPTAQLAIRPLGTSPDTMQFAQVLVEPGTASSVTISAEAIETRGPLWRRIQAAYDHYRALGCPTLEDYHLEISQQTFAVQVHGERWARPL